jgi:hypothetical protein
MGTTQAMKLRTREPLGGATSTLAVRSRPGVALAMLALGGLGAMAGCNVILGIDDYRDVAVEICGCKDVPEYVSNCQTQIRDSLAKADPDVRERWLGAYDTLGCGSCKEPNIVSCLQQPPVCRGLDDRCEGLLDCCGVVDEERSCIDGRCRACIPTNDPGAPSCNTTADCCGGVFRAGEVYCHEGRCIEEAPNCGRFIEACTENESCCGFEAGETTGRCTNGLGCFEQCLPDNANCPNCCAKLSGDGVAFLPANRACVDGPESATGFQYLVPPGATFCDIVCELGIDETCPEGYECKDLLINTVLSIQLCLGRNCPDGSCPDGFSCADIPVKAPDASASTPPVDVLKLCVPNK